MAKTIKKKNGNKSVNMTIREANAHNVMTPNNAFMIGIGTEDNPEFIYPEELEPSVVTANKKESDYKRTSKEASTFRNRNLIGHIGAGLDQNLGDKSLQNIAALSIGVPLIATNPATAPILENTTKGILHTGKVLFDPTKAITGVGQATATTADIYGTIEGLRQVPNATRNIIQGNGTGMDYFNLVTGLMGPFGTFNAIKGARFNPYLRQVAGYKNLGLEDGDRLNHIEQITNNVRTPADDPNVQRMLETQRIRTQQMINQAEQAEDDLPDWVTQGNDVETITPFRPNVNFGNNVRIPADNSSATRLSNEIANEARTQIRRNLGYSDDIDIDFDDEGRMVVSGRHGRINESGSSVTNNVDELQQQDDEINAIISRNTPRFQPLFPEVYERNTIREIKDKNLLGRYIELKTGKTLSDIADNYVLVDLQPVPIDEIKTIMRNKGFNEEFINFSLQNFAESVRNAIGNPINANNIRGFNYHKFEPDFRTGTQAFRLNKVRTNPETGIKHIFENYFGLHSFGNRIFNNTSRIKGEDKEILDELISLYNNRTSSNLSFNDLDDVDKFADFRNFLRTLWSDKKFPGDINGMAWSDAEGFGEFKPFSTPSNYDAMKILRKSEDILNKLPRGYSMAVDDTSYDSEMLKLLKVIKNKDKYGRKAGQYSVESLGTSSWGNNFHKEQIRIGDILNEYRDRLSQSDIDYIESIINRNPNGKPSPELINIIKDKYDLLGEQLAKNLYKTWGRILDIDPSLNIDKEIIRYEPFNEHGVFNDIIRNGKTTPRIYRPDIRIHHNKLGGKLKFKFGGMKQDKPFKLKGGVAIPLDKTNKLFYLSGAKHEQGGIDVTPELEAEGGEVVKINPKSIKVVTAQKIMGGKSPAELVVDASSTGKSEKVFNKVFDYQEDFKDRHNLNDDGTKKAKWGIVDKIKNSKVDKQILNHLKFETFFDNEKYDSNIIPMDNQITNGEYELYPIAEYSPYNKSHFYKKDDKIVYDDNKDYDRQPGYMQYKGYEPLNYDELRKMLPKRDYIGGSKRDVGIKVINKVPGLKDEILRLSEVYGISPNVFTQRLINEGWVQDQAGFYNRSSVKEQKNYNWDRMNNFVDGFNTLGLDTFGNHHKAGHLNLRRDIKYDDNFTTNEDGTGRIYNSADFDNMYDALEAKAAMIEYLTKLGKNKGHSGSDLDAWVNAAYNMGEYHEDLKNMDYVRRKYGIKPYYRYGGQMKNKKKADLGIQETLNKFGQHYYPAITPSINISTIDNNTRPSFGKQLHSKTNMVEPDGEIIDSHALDFTAPYWDYLNNHKINLNRGNVAYPYGLEEVVQSELKSESSSNQAQNNNVTTNRVQMRERTTPTTTKVTTTPVQTNTKSFTPTTTNSESTNSTNNFRSLNLDFLNEITNPNGSTYNLRTGETYIKDWNKVRRTPYSSLNLKTGKTEYAGFINPYGSEIQSAVYDNGPQGRQERTAKERLLNAGDWITIGSNALGAVGNLLTGLFTPDIKYARMRDSIPLIAPKINSNVNTTAEENAIDEAYNDEIRAINENTADSKTALNRKRNAASRKRQAKVKVRSAAENIKRDLINKGNILKGEYDKFNIQRQENVDAYNRQADAAEFNANRTKVSDAITGFLSDLTGSASTITNAIERRQADRKNTVLSYLANPNVDPARFK